MRLSVNLCTFDSLEYVVQQHMEKIGRVEEILSGIIVKFETIETYHIKL